MLVNGNLHYDILRFLHQLLSQIKDYQTCLILFIISEPLANWHILERYKSWIQLTCEQLEKYYKGIESKCDVGIQ